MAFSHLQKYFLAIVALVLIIQLQSAASQSITVTPGTIIQGQQAYVSYTPKCAQATGGCQGDSAVIVQEWGQDIESPNGQISSGCAQGVFTSSGSLKIPWCNAGNQGGGNSYQCALAETTCAGQGTCSVLAWTNITSLNPYKPPGQYVYCGVVGNSGGAVLESTANYQYSEPASQPPGDTYLYSMQISPSGGYPIGTISTNPPSIISGTSANSTADIYDLGQNPDPKGVYWVYVANPKDGSACPSTAINPGIVATLPTCSSSSGAPCLVSSSTVGTTCGYNGNGMNTNNWLWLDYSCYSYHWNSNDFVAPATGGYCVYYSSDHKTSDAQFVETAPQSGPSISIFTTDINAPPYGLSFGITPILTLGGVFTITTYPTGSYVNTDGGITSSGVNMCDNANNGNSDNEQCIIEFGGLQYPQQGCVAPISTASGSPKLILPYCNIPPNGGTSRPTGVTPCIIQTIANSGQVGGQSYSQFLSSSYLADGTYQVCGYNYMDVQPGSQFLAPDFTSALITCSGGVCGSQNAPGPQGSVSVSCVGAANPIGGQSCIGLANFSLFPLALIICNVYGLINSVFFILALILMLLGAVLYGSSFSLPGQLAGTAQGYSQGLLLVGVIAGVISAVSFWLLSLAAGTALLGCALPPAVILP